MFMWRRPAGKTRTSAVLLRQVPIRFDEAPRSWLGGVAQMRDYVVWSRTKGNKAPPHSIVQIACADLPPGVWGGLGPRKGRLFLYARSEKARQPAGRHSRWGRAEAAPYHVCDAGPDGRSGRGGVRRPAAAVPDCLGRCAALALGRCGGRCSSISAHSTGDWGGSTQPMRGSRAIEGASVSLRDAGR